MNVSKSIIVELEDLVSEAQISADSIEEVGADPEELRAKMDEYNRVSQKHKTQNQLELLSLLKTGRPN